MCNPNRKLHSSKVSETNKLKAELALLQVENRLLKEEIKPKQVVKVVSPKTCEATRYFLKHEDVLN